ncbi:GTPase IMAP family member 9-like, partial [Colossoma macropomum]|uniref:GTPase IMAP family member 9-like n=1 Tax=Colossoma macropomum TaxID=42526 RepID=UPI0018646FD0
MADPPKVTEELRMVLLGRTDVGKSATANGILGSEIFKETETMKCEIARGTVAGRNISVIDTPGMNNTSLSTEELKSEMKRCVSLSFPGPHVFLLVIRLEMFTEEEKNAVKWIQQHFGKGALKFTMVLFTGREKITKDKWLKFSQGEQICDFLSNFGAGHFAINRKEEINPSQITKLVDKIQSTVQQNMGQYYTHEMEEAAQRKKIIENEMKEKKSEEVEKLETQERGRQKQLERLEVKRVAVEDESRPNKDESGKEEAYKHVLDDRALSKGENLETVKRGQTVDIVSQDEAVRTEDYKGGKQLEKDRGRRTQRKLVKHIYERRMLEAKYIQSMKNFKRKEKNLREKTKKQSKKTRAAEGITSDSEFVPASELGLGRTGCEKRAAGNTILGREER